MFLPGGWRRSKKTAVEANSKGEGDGETMKHFPLSGRMLGLLALGAWLVLPWTWWASRRAVPRSTISVTVPDSEYGAFSDDGRMLSVFAHPQDKVMYWDTATGRQIKCVDLGGDSVQESTWAEHGAPTYTYTSNGRWLIMLQKGGFTMSMGTFSCQDSAFSSDRRIRTTWASGSVDRWYVATGQLLSRCPLHGHFVALSPGHDFLVSAPPAEQPRQLPKWVPNFIGEQYEQQWESSYALQLLSASTGEPIASFPGATNARFLPDGKTLATYHAREGVLKLWELPPRTMVPSWLPLLVSLGAMLLSGTWWRICRRRRATDLVASLGSNRRKLFFVRRAPPTSPLSPTVGFPKQWATCADRILVRDGGLPGENYRQRHETAQH